MPTTRQLRSPRDFADFLDECNVRHAYDPELRLFSLYSRPELFAADVWVEWLQATGVVRVFSWVLMDIPEERLSEMALCVAEINQVLLMPGFVLDVEHRWVAWRGVAVLDGAGAVSSDVPASLIHMAVRASDRFHGRMTRAARVSGDRLEGALPSWAAEP